MELAQRLGMTRLKVYKWNYDQKKRDEKAAMEQTMVNGKASDNMLD